MNVVEKERCCGCGACVYACNKNAIVLKTDSCGFVYSEIDQDKCINCKKCQKVCPALHNAEDKNSILSAYAVVSTDETAKNSASGGLFAIIAKRFIEKGGIVFGTTMTKDLNVKVVGIKDVNDIILLQGSKYVQADIFPAYPQIEEQIMQNKPVLFAGTPCQVSAIKKLFGKYDNLFTVDLICHGTPNRQMFKDSVKFLQEKHKEKIAGLCFRDAKYGHRMIGSIVFENGKRKKLPAYKYAYYSLFLKDSIISSACHNCKYANLSRISDMTIGDYWGVHLYEKDFYADCVKKGFNRVSAAILNTNKGTELFKSIKNDIIFKETNIEKIQKRNPSLQKPVSPNKDREKCLGTYLKGGYSALNDYYQKKYKKSNLKAALYASLPNFVVNILKKAR